MLKAGSTRVHLEDGEVPRVATGPGFFQVLENRAIALVDDAVAAGDIDEERARRQLEEAQEELAKLDRASRRPTAGSSSNASATPRTSSRSQARASSIAVDVDQPLIADAEVVRDLVEDGAAHHEAQSLGVAGGNPLER